MKKHLLRLSVFLTVGGIIYFTDIQNTFSVSAGGSQIEFCTNSPYDGGSCAQGGCHPSPLTASPKSWITSNVPVTGYIPGTTYTITCRAVNKTSGHSSNYGFEFTTQNSSSTGAVIGTLANITTSGKGSTKISSSSPSSWVTHTSSSYSATDSAVWSFKWTAPASGVGAVKYYATFNCGSGDNQSSAIIYWDSAHFIEASTVGVAQVADVSTNEISVYPNPVKDVFNVSYSLQDSKQVEVNLYSIDGKQIGTLLSGAEQSAGDHNHALHMPSVAPGIYLIQVIQGDQASYKKVVVE